MEKLEEKFPELHSTRNAAEPFTIFLISHHFPTPVYFHPKHSSHHTDTEAADLGRGKEQIKGRNQVPWLGLLCISIS